MAQRKLTEPQDTAAIDLPDLTDQQARFVEGLLKGMSASDAYRSAYDTANMQPSSIWVAASRLKDNANVALWLAQARKNGLGAATVSLEGHLQELERLKAIAIETGNVGAAVQAEQLRGKAAGHYVEKHQDVGQSTDVTSTLKDIEKINPDLAAQLAAQHGIPWNVDEGATKH